MWQVNESIEVVCTKHFMNIYFMKHLKNYSFGHPKHKFRATEISTRCFLRGAFRMTSMIESVCV